MIRRSQHRAPTRPQKASAGLFADAEADLAPSAGGAYTANIDGAARGNPGPASYGVVVRGPDGAVLASLRKYIGRHTNNVAEYYALIAALDYAAAHNLRRLRVRSDSELLVRQMQGRYKVRSPDLRPLYERARKMAAGLEMFAIEHVRREQNSDADALANAALDGPGNSAAQAGVVQTGVAQGGVAQAGARPAGRTIRAQFRAGALHPLDPQELEALALEEGSVVRLRVEPAPGRGEKS